MEKIPEHKLRDLYTADYVASFEKNFEAQQKRLMGIVKRIHFAGHEIVGDFACGNGILAQLIHDKVGAYYGIDFSDEFIEVCKRVKEKKQFKNVHFYTADMVAFCKEKNDFFDAIFTLDFSEHIYDEDFLRIYTAIYVALKPGGKLYLHTPNADYLIEQLKDKGIMKQFPEHIAVRNARHYRQLLAPLGFSHVEIKFIPHYNVLRHLHVLSYIPLLGRFFKARILICCTK